MKKLRSICMLLAVLLVGGILPLRAMAAQEKAIVQKIQIDGTTAVIRCANLGEEGLYTVSLNGAPLEAVQEDAGEKGEPVTVFCLVDTSGSISSFKKPRIQDTLMTISESMGGNDAMVLAEVNDQIVIGDPLYLALDREAAIKALAASHKDTNLYTGIVESINQIASNEKYSAYSCLVVLSDGGDCQDNGMTEQEVMTAIERSRIPVYTVALVESNAEREGAKILGSFARASCGGMHLTTVSEGGNKPIRWNASGEEFGKQIWESIQRAKVLSVDLSELEIDRTVGEAELTVQCRVGGRVYEDRVSIPASQLPERKTASPTETTETEPENKTHITQPGNEEKEQEEKNYLYLWLILAAAGLLILAVVVFLLRRAKRPEPELEPMAPEIQPEIQRPAEQVTNLPEPKQRYTLMMTDIPYGTQKVRLTITTGETLTLGRDSQADFILNDQDKKLSRTHFALRVRDGIFCIRDEGSANGTTLNGIPIQGKGWMKFENSDKIRAGSYEYRVTIVEMRGNT